MSHRPLRLALLLSALLVGCNNDSDPPPEPEPTAPQMGVGEVELYDPVHHPDGHFIQPGQTAILALEGVNGTPTPDPGDTASAGVDEMWFEISKGGNLALSIRETTLATIAQAELWNATGGLLIQVNRDTRQGSAALTPGRYGLRLYAAHNEAKPVNLFIQLQESPANPASANRTLMADQNDVNLLLSTKNCPKCDLSGADLSGGDLHGANLAGAFLNEAYLDRANLTGAILNEAILNEAFLTGAKLEVANLSEANLTGANLIKAYLYKANLTGANLTGANLTGADLSFATWTDGRVCAIGSVGKCR